MNEKIISSAKLSPTSPPVDLKNDLVKALTNSEQHFKSLVNLLPICLMIQRAGMIIYANPGLLHLLGYGKEDELVGQAPLSLVSPESQEEVKNRIQKIFVEGQAENPVAELKIKMKNGGLIDVEGESISVVYQGLPAAMVLFREINQRKKAEETQRNSEENFKAIIQQIPDGIFIENTESILFVSQSVVRMLGYEREDELIGHSPLAFVHPDYHPVHQKRIARIYGKEGVEPLLESQWLKKDGSRLWVEASSISILYEGNPAVMAVLRDTAPRKKAEEALRKSDQNFKSIIQQMPDGVLIVDRDNVLFTNQTFARLLGYSAAEELVGRPKVGFIHPDQHSIVQERIERIIDQGGANPLLKLKMLGKNGSSVEFESSSISIQFDGKPAVMAVLRDITLQNQLEHQAVLNEKLATVGTLAAGIAHEINNPLTYVLANLVFLRENLDELKRQMEDKGHVHAGYPKLFEEILEEIEETAQGGERIREIVRGLKSFVRFDEDEVTAVDLNKTIDSAINMTFHEFKHKARVEKDFAVHLPVLMANVGKLQQVFINLLINAAQSIEGNDPVDNKIHVRTALQEGSLLVEVTDTGKGIPPDILSKIFEPFFTTKPLGVGTGLGLSICDKIVRFYKGTMEVRSQVGKGTLFTVRLPLENGFEAPGTEPIPQSTQQRGRILIVDDEPGNLEVLNRVLKKKNDILSALTGLDALAILEREGGKVDVIVSDLNMPDMNGINLYKIVAQKFPGLEKRFIFITGGIFMAESRDFFKVVHNRCLEKPFKFDELLAAISQWTDASAKRTAL
jgi:two-component system, cell cycle sensor histidine kinase and response regulator CckA